ncbi:MAG: permease-like cell division protein FtsX [Ruminococcus sp.]|nr:permease-like cell division protein FtsX [Ruminococcus sp.]
MSGFGYLVREGFKNIWNNRIMSIASICVLVSCLILTGAASLFSINVQNLVDSVGQSNETTVYLDMSVSELEAVYIGKDIEKLGNISSVEFLSKDDAIMQYKNELGEDIFEGMQGENNPLPHAYIVAMSDLSKYDQTIEQIKNIDGIDDINNRSETARKLTKISNLVSMICFWVVLALTIISLFIIANTIQATMYSRRYEISIMKSVGATNSFVRTPFMVEGMTIGLLSAAISLGGLALLYNGVMEAISDFMHMTYMPLTEVIGYVAIAFTVSGILIGIFGSLISIRKYLKMEGNEILGW